MSNRRKISLPKLAAVIATDMASQKITAPAARAPARTRPAFPRVTAERIGELLDGDRLQPGPGGTLISPRTAAALAAYMEQDESSP